MEHQTVTFPVRCKMQGHFTLIAIDASTGRERLLADFDNLIVNQGLDMLGATPANSVGIVACCIVGTGTTPESPTDTTIETFVAGTKTFTGTATYTQQTSTTPYYTLSTFTYQFPTGAAAGNLTEIGVGLITTTNLTPTGSTPLFSHTLIRSGGVPITITVLSNEILNVIYTIQMFVPSADFTGTFSINIDGTPTTFNYDIKPANVGLVGSSGRWAFPQGIGFQFSAPDEVSNNSFICYQESTWAFSAITTVPSGTNGGSTGGTTGSYTTGTFTNTFTYSIPVGTANYASGIGGIVVSSTPTIWQIGITPAIMKTSLQTLSIVFSIAWSN